MNEDIIKKLKIGYYIDLLIRNQWLIIAIFSFSMVGGIFFSLTRPRIYQARTFIKVIPKSVPDEYVPSVTDDDVSQRINTISLEIKSRTNIEKLIKKYKLFEGPKYEHMFMEDKIAAVRRNIRVNVTKSRKGIDSFTISYSGTSPENVMNTVNFLADVFIDESIRVISEEVVGTKDFLEKELEDKAKRLDEVNEAVRTFREEHIGELPEQLEANLRNLERLQEKQISKQENLRELKHRLILLEKEMADVLKTQNTFEKNLEVLHDQQRRIAETASVAEVKESDDMLKLKELKEQYVILIGKYTNNHPDVIQIKDVIERLEIKIAKSLETAEQTDVSRTSETQISEAMPNSDELLEIKKAETQIADIKKQYIELEKQRNDIIREITIQENDIQNIIKQINMYEKRVEITPKVELRLFALERDVKPIKKAYDTLLSKKEDAVVAVKLEQEQKGQKFRVIDKAKMPEKPISPNMKKLFIMFLGAGLGIGIGLAVLADFLDTSLRRPEDAEMVLDVPVLVTIPKIYQPEDRFMQKIRTILFVFYLMIAIALFSEFTMLTFLGLKTTLKYMKKLAPFLPI